MSELSDMQLRVRALETILTEKGYVDPAVLDQVVENVETKIGPHIGARVVARAWTDPEFKRRLLEDATEAVNSARASIRSPPPDRGREHATDAPHCRLHAVLLLPVVGAGAAAGLVQIGAVPLAHGYRPERRARRIRRRAAAGDRNPHLGFDCRDAVPGGSDATRGDRRLERGAARPARHARQHGRHRSAREDRRGWPEPRRTAP